MGRTKKCTKKIITPVSLLKDKPKSKNSKFKKKKETNPNSLCNKKQLRKKPVIYKIIDDSIVEPNNTSVVYSEEDDSFHEVKPDKAYNSDKTSTPLIPKPLLNSPKLLFSKNPKSNKSLQTPIKEQVNNVSSMLSNVSIILQQMSDNNKSYNQKISLEEGSDVKLSNENSPTEKLNLNTSDNTRNVKLDENEPQNITVVENNNESKKDISVSGLTPKTKYISQLQVNLITTPKNDQAINKDI